MPIYFRPVMGKPSAACIAVLLILSISTTACAQNKPLPNDNKTLKMAFWNMENLMDTIDGEGFDGDFTPTGANAWNSEKYSHKLENMARGIYSMNPDILGMAEVENKQVLEDLIAQKDLIPLNFGIVHHESPDERGIDVALLYNKSELRFISSEAITVTLSDTDRTRDILYVMLLSKKSDTLHVFVNHWPSRRGGRASSDAKRAIAAQTLRQFIEKKQLQHESLVIVGDLNDDPQDNNVKYVLSARPLNALEENGYLLSLNSEIQTDTVGTLKFGNAWNMFDQMIISDALYKSNSGIKYHKGSFSIFAPDWLKQSDGKYKGSPFRTFGGKNWLDGYSDHFPVCAEFYYE
jgi:predicted extracellular nuclease